MKGYGTWAEGVRQASSSGSIIRSLLHCLVPQSLTLTHTLHSAILPEKKTVQLREDKKTGRIVFTHLVYDQGRIDQPFLEFCKTLSPDKMHTNSWIQTRECQWQW